MYVGTHILIDGLSILVQYVFNSSVAAQGGTECASLHVLTVSENTTANNF